jgi:hypothetical protein
MAEIIQQFMQLTQYTAKVPALLQNYNSFLEINFKIMNKKKGGFFGNRKKNRDEKYNVTFFDPRSGKTETKQLNYYKFVSDLSMTMQVLVQLKDRESRKYREIQSSSVDKVWNFFFDLYFDIYTLKEKCIGFENLLMGSLKNAFKNEKDMNACKNSLEKLIKALYEKQVEISDQL